MNIEEMAGELVERITTEIFGGVLPPFTRQIAFAIASACVPPDTDKAIVEEYYAALIPALEARLCVQDARWLS